MNKTPLEVYYYIDLDNNQEIDKIEKCLSVYISTQKQEFEIKRFERFIPCKEVNKEYLGGKYDINSCDVVSKGLIILARMYNELKLKTKDDVWFIFMSNGDIKMSYKDISLILLNKNPSVKECNYIVNKNKININNNMDKSKKMDSIKNLTKSLKELFASKKNIKYNNIAI